jgi:hypothetical protein
MSRKNLFSITFAAAAFCGVMSAAEWNRTYTVSAAPELRIDTNDGAVTVRVWDEKRIEVRILTRGWNIGPGGVHIDEHQTGDRVDVQARLPEFHMDVFNMQERWLRIEVQTPRDTRADIHTGDGSVKVSGLRRETRINTGDGSVEVDGVEGALDARTGDGSVRVRGRFDTLNIHTGDGSVDADLAPGSRLAAPWKIETGDGSVTVRVPPQLAADLDVHTGDGGITMDVPLTLRAGKVGGNDVRGQLNGGGAPFYIRTGDGGIHVLKL